jgi:ABC-type dipeptide/oligopeptide/nickel transport system permease component
MATYLVRRLGLAVFVVWGVVTMVFVVMRLVPGDPANAILGIDATQEEVEQLRSKLGLDRSIPEQYAIFVRQAAGGDLGRSTYSGQPALELIVERLPATIRLAIAALVLASIAAFVFGVTAALRANSVLDKFISFVTILGQSLPDFWIGLMLILVFSGILRLLPTFGSDTLQHLILPAVTLALPLMGATTRLVRSGMLEILGQDYIRTARAKGLKESLVVRRHAVKNMLIPVVTVFGLRLGYLLGGSVIVETVFSWPGVGNAIIFAISSRDYSVVQAATLVVAISFVAINLAIDLIYVLLDPRIRFA